MLVGAEVSNAAPLYFCQTEGVDSVEEVQNLGDDFGC
jgi:hypothetical protein